MTVCKTCKHANYCEIVAGGYSSQVKSCRDYRKGEMTNEEWLRQASTEELAEFLADKCNEVVDTVLSDASCDIGDVDNDDYWYRQADFVEWLKQQHKDTK